MRKARLAAVRTHIINKEGDGDRSSSDENALEIPNGFSHLPNGNSHENKGVDALNDVLVEVETSDGLVGMALGEGGFPVCYLIEHMLKPILVGEDARNIARLWDRMFHTVSLDLGRTGLPMMALSAVDLALWDLLGRMRGEPVHMLIGGATKDVLSVYHTGARAEHGKALGFPAAKVTLPHGVRDGSAGFSANIEFLRETRAAVGQGYPFAIDCWMSLDVRYALDLAAAIEPLNVRWIEEPLHPEDHDGYLRLKAAMPKITWTTGEHHYTRYGFQRLVADRAVDILQPDIRWCGGLTETLRIAAMASAFDIPVIPHCGGVYSYHFAMAQPNVPCVEYFNASVTGEEMVSVHGPVVSGEPLPHNGEIILTDAPGWGLEREASPLVRAFRVEQDGRWSVPSEDKFS